MRRRQMFHQIHLEDEIRRKRTQLKKGQCPHCFEMIGKGIAGHMRGCNGDNSTSKSEHSRLSKSGRH